MSNTHVHLHLSYGPTLLRFLKLGCYKHKQQPQLYYLFEELDRQTLRIGERARNRATMDQQNVF